MPTSLICDKTLLLKTNIKAHENEYHYYSAHLNSHKLFILHIITNYS